MAVADTKVFEGLNTRTRMVDRFHAYFERALLLLEFYILHYLSLFLRCSALEYLPLITTFSFRFKTAKALISRWKLQAHYILLLKLVIVIHFGDSDISRTAE